MQLEDFSSLKPTEDIEIPLNGQTYYADPAPATELVLDAITGGMTDADIDVALRAEQGAPMDQAEMSKAARLGMNSTRGVLTFLQDVLRPESAERWAANMKAKGTPEAISLAQCVAVYRALIQEYSGSRPTTPSASSQNGRGRT